ncbi:MAG: LexA family protein [Lysobacteraceae bacterium]
MSRSRNRSLEVLAFIQARIAAGEPSPTLEEIAAACGFKSRSAAQKHVRVLEAGGQLEVIPHRARGARPKRPKEQPVGATPFFEVNPRDIYDLTDTDLRALVARLCMATVAERGHSPTAVIWGGDQRASDGGIDVRVQAPSGSTLSSPLERPPVGLQVKATKMGATDIQREMCPSGLLRLAIRDLIEAKGTYIIAASDLVADEEYQHRVATMKEAARSAKGADEASFDYFDSRRLADWTNQHPGVVAWVRSRLGRPLQGWQPFGPWTTSSNRDGTLFADPKLRLSDPLNRDNKLTLVEGLAHVRRQLRAGGSSVRLTGLSGVGKTRFAQALFEASAADDPLTPELAVYTDTGHSPVPSPQAVLDELLAARRHAILIVDNCGTDLHNKLSARCRGSDRVSLLTIEYDIREDLANQTSVLQLEAGSEELIEHVIEQQFPHISQVNRRTIARFADGNSRVAIALAHTMARNDSLAGLNDDELFDRLFWLGKEKNQELRHAAEACALVYSFDIDDDEGELAQLATLADARPFVLFRHIADLEKRGLAQRRGKWRAILPHAIANRLAAHALTSIPMPQIERHIVRNGIRLLKSFSRRLGYLHKSPEAIAIVQSWLSADGRLGDITRISDDEIEIFVNIAPVDTAATLDAIKRALKGPHGDELLASSSPIRSEIVEVIRQIAYYTVHFDDCMTLLVRFAQAEAAGNGDKSTRDVISSLFQIYLSGTHASTEQRASWVRSAMTSNNSIVQTIGLKALSRALECYHLSSHYNFEFGAHDRDYGSSPQGPEARRWLETFIAIAVEVATSHESVSEEARNALASQFRSLWTFGGTLDALELATHALLPIGWERGWLAIRQTLRFEGKKGLGQTSYARLLQLEKDARPTSLVGRVRAIVFNTTSAGVDYADGESASSGYDRANNLARELGELVAVDNETFTALLPMIVSNVHGRLWYFGEGLAAAAPSLPAYWEKLTAAFESTASDARNLQTLRGFLYATHKRDRNVFEQFLDEAMVRSPLAEWVPVLQLSAPLDERGCDRLLASMNNANVPAWVFQHLGYGQATKPVSDDRLADLLERLSIKPGGTEVAIDILHMHIHGEPTLTSSRLTACAQKLIGNAPLSRQHHGLDHALSILIERFLQGKAAEPAARKLLERVHQGIVGYSVSRHDLTETLKTLFHTQPKMALDILVDGDEAVSVGYVRRSEFAGGRRSSALAAVPEQALLDWCRSGDNERWARVAPLVPAFSSVESGSELQWSPLVQTLLRNAPDPVRVAATLIDTLAPTTWSGSRSEIIRQRLPLLDKLSDMLGSEHESQVIEWRRQVTDLMEREARHERAEQQSRNERFE